MSTVIDYVVCTDESCKVQKLKAFLLKFVNSWSSSSFILSVEFIFIQIIPCRNKIQVLQQEKKQIRTD